MAQASQQLLTGYGPDLFISSWKTDNAGTSTSTQITVPTIITGTYNCVVYWGDGNASTMTTYNDAAWTHTYGVAGTYTVKIYGTFVGIRFANGGDKLKLLNISRWGKNFRLGTTENGYLNGCNNLTITATDVLNLSGTTTMQTAFQFCSSITTVPSINSWDWSGVTNLTSLFNGCSTFNQSLNFNTSSSLTTIASVINACTIFNGTVNFANVTNVTSFSASFSTCPAFTQTDFSFLNSAAPTTMANMFLNSTLCNPDCSGFTIRNLQTSANGMLNNCGLTKANLNKIYSAATGWPSQGTIKNNVVFTAAGVHYDGTDAINGRAVLTGTHTWTITDGGTP